MKRVAKNLIPLAIVFFAIATLSSCNRGMGCPNNFSISKTVVKTVVSQTAAIVKK